MASEKEIGEPGWLENAIFDMIFDEVDEEESCKVIREACMEVMEEEAKDKEAEGKNIDREKMNEIQLSQEEISDLLENSFTDPTVATEKDDVELSTQEKALVDEIIEQYAEPVEEMITINEEAVQDIIRICNAEEQEDSRKNEMLQKRRLELEEYFEENQNPNTKRKTDSTMRKFKQWVIERYEEEREVESIPEGDLDLYIADFLKHAKKIGGGPYEPDSLTSFHRAIERYLQGKGYEFSLLDPNHFKLSRKTLGEKRKDLKKEGMGNKKNAAVSITDDQVEEMWDKKILGNGGPQSLQTTIFFYFTLCFGFRGNDESGKLRWGDVELVGDEAKGNEYLEFNERQTKTRTGAGNNSRAFHPKIFPMTNKERCPIKLYKEYKSHRPAEALQPDSRFFLSVITFPGGFNEYEDRAWYKVTPMGKNKLAKIMPEIAFKLGWVGKITNHSIRKTLCSNLLNEGVNPNLIIQVTGHKNVNSISNYAAANIDKQKELFSLLTSRCVEDGERPSTSREEPPPSKGPLTESNSSVNRMNFQGAEVKTPKRINKLSLKRKRQPELPQSTVTITERPESRPKCDSVCTDKANIPSGKKYDVEREIGHGFMNGANFHGSVIVNIHHHHHT